MRPKSLLLLILSTLCILFASIGQLYAKIIAVGDNAYPPLEYIDENGNAAGFNVDIFKAVMKELGLEYEIRLMNWSDAVKAVEEKKADVFIDFGFDELRAKKFEYGYPHTYIPFYAVYLDGTNFSTLDDLRGKRIILLKNRISQCKLPVLYPNENYTYVDTPNEAFEMLTENGGDVFICSEPIATFYVNKTYDSRIKYRQLKDLPPFVTSFAALKGIGKSELLHQLDDAESTIRKNGIYTQIANKWFAVDNTKISRSTFWFFISSILGVVFVILILILIYYRYRRERNYEQNLIINGVTIPVVLVNSKGEFIAANKAFEELHSIKMNSVKKCVDYIRCPFQCEKPFSTDCILREAIESRQTTTKEIKFYGRTYLITGTPIFNKHGDFIYLVESLFDIDDLKRLTSSERMINEFLVDYIAHDNYKAMIENLMRKLLTSFDADHCYITNYYDDNSLSIEFDLYSDYGSKARSLIPDGRIPISRSEFWYETLRKRRKLLCPDTTLPTAREFFGSWNDFIKKLGIKSLYSFGIYDGRKLVGSCGLAFCRNKKMFNENDENLFANVSHMLDAIRTRKANHQKLLNALHEAKEAEKAKSYFLASMSHEIRTPLNSVIGFANLLKNDADLDAKTRAEYASNIAFAGSGLLDLINDILDLSKLESGSFRVHNSLTDLKKLFEDIENFFTLKLQNKNLTSSFNVSESMPKLFIDRQILRQVMFNLIGNAIKFTDSGSITTTASFEKNSSEVGTLSISVRDTGIGIKPSDIRKIFKPFIQSDAMRGTFAQNQGTGLGLAICRQMLEHMDGNIDVESDFGNGSVFNVVIKNVKFDACGCTGDECRKNIKDLWQGKKVLLVDDVKMNLTILSAIVRKTGANISVADTPEKALELFASNDFDIVLSDIWMPNINGAELAKKMRDIKKSVKIYAVTADVECGKNFDMSPFNAVLTKPVSIERLAEVSDV